FPGRGGEPGGHGRSCCHPRCAAGGLCARAGRARYLGRYRGAELRETRAHRRELCRRRQKVTLADQGMLELGEMRLEYRMIGLRPDAAPTLLLLHEGLRCVAGWGSFWPDLAAAPRARGIVLSRARYRRPPPARM